MSVIKIQNFTGENPRTSARVLAITDSAQENRNLLATSPEFRPLAADAERDTLAAPKANAKTLHVFPDESYIALAGEFNAVRTQLNDNATERTYFSDNTGATAPFEADAIGSILRQLGVPPPTVAPVLERYPRRRFTQEQGERWIGGDLTGQVLRAIDPTDSDEADNNYAFARLALSGGNRSGTDMGDGRLRFVVEDAVANMLGNSDGTPIFENGAVVFRRVTFIHAFPNWATITNKTAVATAIAAIDSPLPYTSDAQTAPVKVFNSVEAGLIAQDIYDIWNPAANFLKADRAALDRVIEQFNAAVSAANALALEIAGMSAVAPPERPTGPEFEFVAENQVLSAPWRTYYDQLADGNFSNSVTAAQRAEKNTQLAAKAADMKRFQAEAKSLVDKIEAEFNSRRDRRFDLVGQSVRRIMDLKVQSGEIAWDAEAIRETRYYVYTYVTDRGEESQPSPVSAPLDVDIGDTVRIQFTQPLNAAAHNIAYVRLYRSNVGTAGAEFQYLPYYQSQSYASRKWTRLGLNEMGKPLLELTQVVPENNIASVYFYDTQIASDLQESLPSTTWAPPPSITSGGVTRHIKGFVNLPGGVIAGFLDNFVAFSEPFRPYAWPVEYQVPLDSPVTGLGVIGQTLVVGTQASPYTISGSDPATMTPQKLADNQACASLRSIITMGNGVVYASPDGLCLANEGGVQVITSALFAREDWQALNPASIVAGHLDGVYYFTYTGNGGGTFALDFQARKLTRVDFKPSTYASVPRSDALLYVQGNKVMRAFASGRRLAKWKSGLLTLPAHSGFAWVQVDGEQSVDNPVTVGWYADGVIRHTATFTDTRPQRLPMGRYLEHEIVVESRARVTKVVLASTTQELQQV